MNLRRFISILAALPFATKASIFGRPAKVYPHALVIVPPFLPYDPYDPGLRQRYLLGQWNTPTVKDLGSQLNRVEQLKVQLGQQVEEGRERNMAEGKCYAAIDLAYENGGAT